jgi:hypothetical protein
VLRETLHARAISLALIPVLDNLSISTNFRMNNLFFGIVPPRPPWASAPYALLFSVVISDSAINRPPIPDLTQKWPI